MTQEEEMYEMAWQAGCVNTPIGELKRFAALVAAKATANEREAQEDARQPLTEAEVSSVYFEVLGTVRIQDPTLINRLARAIEAAHGITAAQKGGQHGTE